MLRVKIFEMMGNANSKATSKQAYDLIYVWNVDYY